MTSLKKTEKPIDLSVDSSSHVLVSDILALNYSTLDLIKCLGIPRERFRDWMNRGYIMPTKSAEGQGTKALFSPLDAYSIGLFKYLVEVYKLAREEAGRFASSWKTLALDQHKNGQGDFRIICFCRKNNEDNEDFLVRPILSGKIVKNFYKDTMTWDSILVINMEKIIDDINRRLKVIG